MPELKGEVRSEVAGDVDLSILIVGYNSRSFLDACLGSIAGSLQAHSCEVLFVNNGTDSSEEFVRTCYPDVRVLETKGNIGFAAGNDYLADHAAGQWLLLLNPDTRLYVGALDVLLAAAAQHGEYQVLGGLTVREDGEPQTLAQIELPTLASMLRGLIGSHAHMSFHEVGTHVSPVDALNGGFMMVRRDVWQELGGLDPSFFLYAEELDFFRRLRDRGWRAARVNGSRVFHDIGSGEVYSPTRIRFLATGNAHYFHKHFAPPYAYACIAVMWATMMRRYVSGRILSSRHERYGRLSRGFAHVAKAPWTWMWGYRSAGADPRKGL